jgi:hypothetical protein
MLLDLIVILPFDHMAATHTARVRATQPPLLQP